MALIQIELVRPNQCEEKRRINWIVYFEEKVKSQLPKGSKVTPFFFKDADFGDLVRFVIEINNKEGIVDCYSTGTVSIEAFDFTKEDQIFICLSFPSEIESIEQSFHSLIKAIE